MPHVLFVVSLDTMLKPVLQVDGQGNEINTSTMKLWGIVIKSANFKFTKMVKTNITFCGKIHSQHREEGKGESNHTQEQGKGQSSKEREAYPPPCHLQQTPQKMDLLM